MNVFWVVIGTSFVFLALYRICKLYKKSKKISNNSLILGFLVAILLIEALDKLTINLLVDYLGETYYNRLVGVLFDAIIIGIAVRKPPKKFSRKEYLIDKIQFGYALVFFTWYFMYYLCK